MDRSGLSSARQMETAGRGQDMTHNVESKKPVWIERALIKSLAFRELTATALRVFFLFMLKRSMEKLPIGRGRKTWVIANNGKIEFTYREADCKYGIKEGAFREALDRLVERGFIDIAANRAGLFKVKTLYSLSERWRKFGTPEFERKERPKDNRHVGYQKRNVRKATADAARGIENGAGHLEAAPSQSQREWQSIEGVGKGTRQSETAETGGPVAIGAVLSGMIARPGARLAAWEKRRDKSGRRVREATQRRMGKATLTSDDGRQARGLTVLPAGDKLSACPIDAKW